jgi:wobble nucleotide-excising tRNase
MSQGNDLSNTIVFVDDPVSSLDANCLFSSYSLIKNKLLCCHQLFVSTHNVELLNLLKGKNRSGFGDETARLETAFYNTLLERNRSRICSRLMNMPSLLLDFRSEYHYLFAILWKFHENPSDNFSVLYSLPNITRRFLEAFLGFRIPEHEGLPTKLKTMITDEVKREKVNRFVQEYSHNQFLPRSLQCTDLSEFIAVVDIVMQNVAQMDKDHFDRMVSQANERSSEIP